MSDDNDKNSPPTEYDLLDQARTTIKEQAVAFLKQQARLKAMRRGACASDPVGKPDPVGRATDALYQLLQLQFAFGNRVAELHGQYGILANRALERWYGVLSRPRSGEHGELTFTGNAPMTRQFTIESRDCADAGVTLSWGPFAPPGPAVPIDGALVIDVRNGPGLPKPLVSGDKFTPVAAVPCIVRVTVDLAKLPKAPCVATLRVQMAREERLVLLIAERAP